MHGITYFKPDQKALTLAARIRGYLRAHKAIHNQRDKQIADLIARIKAARTVI